MNKIHTISLEDFKKDPFVDKIVASSTGPVSKKLLIRTNILNGVIDYVIEYKDSTILHNTIEQAIDTYNSK